MKRLQLFVLLSLFFVGCATKSEFLYHYPNTTKDRPTGLIVACESLRDERDKPCEIDKIFKANPIEEIGRIIQQEIMSTGLFIEVIQLSEGDAEGAERRPYFDADIYVSAKLLEMDWKVPNYDAMIGKAFGLSVLTGGIGGMIYGSTETDVYDDARIRIKVIDLRLQKTLLDKEYIGHAEEKMKKLKCDTPNTKARMIGNAIEIVMASFKEDLAQAVQEESNHELK